MYNICVQKTLNYHNSNNFILFFPPISCRMLATKVSSAILFGEAFLLDKLDSSSWCQALVGVDRLYIFQVSLGWPSSRLSTNMLPLPGGI